ncbi:MAG: hypothetical protein IPK19_29135 [Chloroflexi bacterium]|nr:hypothetical protein [Chloroflexota bacterium]
MAAFQEATNTVWEEMMLSTSPAFRRSEARMAELEAQLSDETDSAALQAIRRVRRGAARIRDAGRL